jgi:hypothetical protein
VLSSFRRKFRAVRSAHWDKSSAGRLRGLRVWPSEGLDERAVPSTRSAGSEVGPGPSEEAGEKVEGRCGLG